MNEDFLIKCSFMGIKSNEFISYTGAEKVEKIYFFIMLMYFIFIRLVRAAAAAEDKVDGRRR